MTQAQVRQLLAVLKASYPRQAIEQATIGAYELMLQDLEFEATKAAVQRIVCSSKWFPTIAEIRAEASRASSDLLDPEVAWGEVMSAVSRYGAYRSPGVDFEFESSEVDAAVRVIGWKNICLDENVAATRARWIDAYRSIWERSRTSAQLGPHALPGSRQSELTQGARRLLKEDTDAA